MVADLAKQERISSSMLTKIELIATIQNNPETYTLYFFQKKDKVILPIKLPSSEIENLFQVSKEYKNSIPTVYDTFKRLIGCLEAALASITIYRFEQDIYYTYLNVNKDRNFLEINSGFTDAIAIAEKCNVPVFIDKNLLHKNGIKITNKLLKEALGQAYQIS